eukprot:CAMPEP_0206439018 /NCGR_PEP_ID=MMETSP0324_2-20121206/11968_1 /ASSEMBLY_ACC=CAM_ASM_000836 /TAXON_ID=2866 /ORGANISM="Crypthecodinium cohnii, Strain Seligo" /LENGTH=638 /DNA_ID=CAMNT_0053906573 /DNA_START=171 /DNA_END=2084 /DNA_ORIENTATION=+
MPPKKGAPRPVPTGNEGSSPTKTPPNSVAAPPKSDAPKAAGDLEGLELVGEKHGSRGHAWEAYTRVMMVVTAVFYFQDKVLDIFVCTQMIQQNHETWGYIMAFFVVLPFILLFVVNVQLKRTRQALLGLIGISIYFEIRDCWPLGVNSRELIRETDVHMIFSAIPQFMIQSQIVLQSHYLARKCQEAFDVVCTSQCTAIPHNYTTEVSRASCESVNTAECWGYYEACLPTCAALELLQVKEDASRKYRESLLSFDLGKIQAASAATAKASKRMETAMAEDSKSWDTNFCDAQASGLTNVTNPFTGNSVQTIKRSVFLLNMQLPSLIASGISIAATRGLRVVDERADPDIEMKPWIIQVCSFAFHFLFDIFAMCGAISLFYASTTDEPYLRLIVSVVLVLIFQFAVKWTRIYHNSHWTRRVLPAGMYIMMSPMAKLPACRALFATQIRALLRLRFCVQIALGIWGFGRLADDSSDKLQYYKELCLAFGFAAFAILCTRLPGTAEVWGNQWDSVTARSEMTEDLKAFERRKEQKAYEHWRVAIGSVRFANALRQADPKQVPLLFTNESRFDPDIGKYVTLRYLFQRHSADVSYEEIFTYWELECIPREGAKSTANCLSWLDDRTKAKDYQDQPRQDSKGE